MLESVARDVLFESPEQRQQIARNFGLVSRNWIRREKFANEISRDARVYQALHIEIIICNPQVSALRGTGKVKGL